MKYSTLQNDIINILHSSDYDLYLKFYDDKGNTVIDTDKTKWIYINNYNVMISLMDDNNPNISIWKGTNSFNDSMKQILQRIRELANLNGISVDVKVYNNLNQRKIYNLIKYTITKMAKKDDDNMTESKAIDESLFMLINTAHNTRKNSDFYLSEEMKASTAEKIIKEMIDEVYSLQSCKSLSKNTLNKLFTIRTLSETKDFVKSLSENDKSILDENVESINNIVKYVHNKYINNVDLNQKKYKTLYILENAKVYTVKENHNRENLVNAYNKLISVSDKLNTGTDLLRAIKKYNLCEKYNVNKHDLINFWLYESNNESIPEKIMFVIEDSNGNKTFFNENLRYGIKALAKYINDGGSKNDSICDNIIKETIKYNEIKDFINTYYNAYSMRKYITRFKDMLSETISKLTSDYNQSLFESVEDIDYKYDYNLLIKESGIDHPAFKYLAMIEAKYRSEYAQIICEKLNKEEEIIFEGLRPFSKNTFECNKCISSFIKDNNKILNEGLEINRNNAKKVASELFNKLDESVKTSPLSSALFNIIHSNKKIDNKNIKFLKTISKYI